jgi:hypothetical protein
MLENLLRIIFIYPCPVNKLKYYRNSNGFWRWCIALCYCVSELLFLTLARSERRMLDNILFVVCRNHLPR